MNRIDTLFDRKQEDVLSVYITAGYPGISDTVTIIRALANSGADMIEVGIPFSDPLADGPVIQHSSELALENGMTLSLLFEHLEGIRDEVDIPLIMMGYLNPVLQYGFEKFVMKCAELGLDGMIIPDLPLNIYEASYKALVEKSGLKFIMLITPQTSEMRIRQIHDLSGGFLYMVADSSTTGVRSGISEEQLAYFERIQGMGLSLPRMIGFGISNAETFKQACKYANGAIIGSAFIRMIAEENGKTIEEKTEAFTEGLLQNKLP